MLVAKRPLPFTVVSTKVEPARFGLFCSLAWLGVPENKSVMILYWLGATSRATDIMDMYTTRLLGLHGCS